jgi:hypothetical protein
MSKTNRSVGDISDLHVFSWAAKCPALIFGGNRQGNTDIWPGNQIFFCLKCAIAYFFYFLHCSDTGTLRYAQKESLRWVS